jgi:hypothetical protein
MREPDDFERHNKRNSAQLTNRGCPCRFEQVAQAPRFGGLSARHRTVFCSQCGQGADSTSISPPTRPLSKEEAEQRERLRVFLDSASEDEFTEPVLLTLFQRLGFYRVSAAGHTEKMREFGKDLWMKFQLPTIPGKLKLS